MKDSECQNGTKVVGQGNRYHSIVGVHGTLANVKRGADGQVLTYSVLDLNGYYIGFSTWISLGSWDVCQPPENRSKFAANQAKPECPCGIRRVDCEYHNGT